jgi:hypothetical protein
VDDERPDPTSPSAEALRLVEEANRKRIDFLRIELETCFTLARVAEDEQARGELHAQQSLADAETGYATLVRFMSDPKHSKNIPEQETMELWAGIERLRAKLDSVAGGRK